MREIDDIHIPFLAWLHELEVPVIYHRPDRKSGIQRGMPDFTVTWMSRVVFIEAKTPEGRLSKVQENVIRFLRAAGNRVEICRSFEECKEAVKNILLEKGVTVPVIGTEDLGGDVGIASCADHRESTESVSDEAETAGIPPAQNILPQQPLADRNEEGPKSANFYIIQWKGDPYVVARDLDNKFRYIRQASAIDVETLPKLP